MINATDIIKRSAEIYKNNFGTFLKYLLLSVLPALIISIVLGFGMFFVAGAAGSAAGAGTSNGIASFVMMLMAGGGTFVVLGIIAAIIVGLLQFWFKITFSRVISKLEREAKDGGIKDELADSSSVFFRAIGVGIWISILVSWPFIALMILVAILQSMNAFGSVVALIFGVLGIVAVIYSIYMGIKLVFAYFGVIIDKMTITESVEFSKEKVSGNWWAVLWRLVAPFAGISILISIINFILNGLGSSVENMTAMLVAGVLVFLINFLAVPLLKTLPIILYNDIKKGTNSNASSRSSEKNLQDKTDSNMLSKDNKE